MWSMKVSSIMSMCVIEKVNNFITNKYPYDDVSIKSPKYKLRCHHVKAWVTISLIQANRTLLNVVMSKYVHHFVWNHIKNNIAIQFPIL